MISFFVYDFSFKVLLKEILLMFDRENASHVKRKILNVTDSSACFKEILSENTLFTLPSADWFSRSVCVIFSTYACL